jgi:hypothetical protein
MSKFSFPIGSLKKAKLKFQNSISKSAHQVLTIWVHVSFIFSYYTFTTIPYIFVITPQVTKLWTFFCHTVISTSIKNHGFAYRTTGEELKNIVLHLQPKKSNFPMEIRHESLSFSLSYKIVFKLLLFQQTKQTFVL